MIINIDFRHDASFHTYMTIYFILFALNVCLNKQELLLNKLLVIPVVILSEELC